MLWGTDSVAVCYCLLCVIMFLQQEARLERQEDRLHRKAVRAALHGNIGKAIVMEVSKP